jgi:hypothetical protein
LKISTGLAIASTIIFIVGVGLILIPLVSVMGISVSMNQGTATVKNNGHLKYMAYQSRPEYFHYQGR